MQLITNIMTVLSGGFILITLLLFIFYIWIKYQFSYWKRKNIPYIPPKIFGGSLYNVALFRESVAKIIEKLYNDPKTENEPFVGIHIFHKPGLLIKDLDLIKKICIKDFNYFTNRYAASDPHSDGLGGYNLFFVKNPIWKQLRNSLTPFFTSGKMKQMFHLVNDIGEQLNLYLCSLTVDENTNSVCKEIQEICGNFTTDVIASIAFGIESNSIINPNAEFRYNGKRIFNFSFFRAIEFTSIFFLPQIISFFKFKVFTPQSSKFLRSTLNNVIDVREKSGIQRNDLIDILISLKNSTEANKDKDIIKFQGDILVAQAALFFAAGSESSASKMSFCLYELSRNPHIQDHLRAEIKNALEKNNGILTYDLIQNMEYFDQIFKEILRLYTSFPYVDRECELSQDEKGYSLEPYSDFKIPNGMPVYIPAYAIHRDEKYFPDPDSFNPERFSPENKHNIHPYSYMPFGIGPRNCIGERFGIIQAKIGLIHFLKNHYVRPSNKTLVDMKIKFEKKSIILQAEGGIHLNIISDPLIINKN